MHLPAASQPDRLPKDPSARTLSALQPAPSAGEPGPIFMHATLAGMLASATLMAIRERDDRAASRTA